MEEDFETTFLAEENIVLPLTPEETLNKIDKIAKSFILIDSSYSLDTAKGELSKLRDIPQLKFAHPGLSAIAFYYLLQWKKIQRRSSNLELFLPNFRDITYPPLVQIFEEEITDKHYAAVIKYVTGFYKQIQRVL